MFDSKYGTSSKGIFTWYICLCPVGLISSVVYTVYSNNGLAEFSHSWLNAHSIAVLNIYSKQGWKSVLKASTRFVCLYWAHLSSPVGMLQPNEASLFTLLLLTSDVLTVLTTVQKRPASQMICRLMLIHSAEQAQISTRCSEEPLLPLEQWSVVGFHSKSVE